jgi:S-adenosylmethionine synthetase
MKNNLRYVDPEKDLVIQNQLRPGSMELVDLFQRNIPHANDSSIGVGCAPLTETESLVLEAERFLNSAEFHQRHPEAGEDVKVLGVRRDGTLSLSVAVAIVDRFIASEADYFERKRRIEKELNVHLSERLRSLSVVQASLNGLDEPGRGLEGMYLTVLGTSAESGDGGQVGRGNRVNGLISFCRPMSTEAAAGKNPVSHVGKIYNVLARQTAEQIVSANLGVEEASVWLASRIGDPIDQPRSCSVQISLAKGAAPSDVERPIEEIVEQVLADAPQWCARMVRGELAVC